MRHQTSRDTKTANVYRSYVSVCVWPRKINIQIGEGKIEYTENLIEFHRAAVWCAANWKEKPKTTKKKLQQQQTGNTLTNQLTWNWAIDPTRSSGKNACTERHMHHWPWLAKMGVRVAGCRYLSSITGERFCSTNKRAHTRKNVYAILKSITELDSYAIDEINLDTELVVVNSQNLLIFCNWNFDDQSICIYGLSCPNGAQANCSSETRATNRLATATATATTTTTHDPTSGWKKRCERPMKYGEQQRPLRPKDHDNSNNSNNNKQTDSTNIQLHLHHPKIMWK